MSTRPEAKVMVRAMGMGADLLKKLVDQVQKQGGDPEILGLLTRPRYATNLALIADAIIDCDWTIPASEMRDRAEKWYRENFRAEESRIKEVRNLWWFGPMQDLGLPYISYSDDDGDGEARIPAYIRNYLNETVTRVERPLIVTPGKTWVIVDIGTKSEEPLRGGDIIRGDDLEYIKIAEARYFDFDR